MSLVADEKCVTGPFDLGLESNRLVVNLENYRGCVAKRYERALKGGLHENTVPLNQP